MERNTLFSENYFTESAKKMFIAKAKQQIELYNIFLEHLEVLKTVLNKFNDMPLTTRLKNAFKKECNFNDFYIELKSVGYDDCFKTNVSLLAIFYFGKERDVLIDDTFVCFLENCQFYIDIVLNESNNINAERTIKDINIQINKYKEIIKELNDCITNYDKYKEKAIETEKIVNQYLSEIPPYLRMDFSIRNPYQL